MSTDDVVDRDQARLAEVGRPLSPEMEMLRFAGPAGGVIDVPVLETWHEVPVPGSGSPDWFAPPDGDD